MVDLFLSNKIKSKLTCNYIMFKVVKYLKACKKLLFINTRLNKLKYRIIYFLKKAELQMLLSLLSSFRRLQIINS